MKKIISVVLSFVMLCALVFPAPEFVTYADNEENLVTSAKAEVISAWNNLKRTVEIPFYGYFEGADKKLITNNNTSYRFVTQAQLNGADETFDTNGLPVDITGKEFGSGYVSFNAKSTGAATANYDSVLYDTKSGYSTVSEAIEISDIYDIYFYYKIENENISNADIDAKLYIVNSAYQTYSGSDNYQASIHTNEWQKLSVMEVTPNFLTNYNLTDKNILRFNISFGQGCGSTFTMGGAFLVLNVAAPDDLELLTEAGLLEKYYNTDMSGYTNTEALANAIADLEKAIGKDAYSLKLQTGWKALKAKNAEMDLFKYHNSAGDYSTTDDIAELTDEADDQKLLGSKKRAITLDGTNTNAFSDSNDRLVFETVNANIEGLSDIILTYKVENAAVTSKLNIRFAIATTNQNILTNSGFNNLQLIADGEWHTVKVSDYFKNTDWQAVITSFNEATGNDKFRFFIYHDLIQADIAYGTPIILKDSGTYPTDSLNIQAIDWYISATEVDSEAFYNNLLFEEALTDLKTVLGEEIENYSYANLLEHVPAAVYRTDANGVKAALGEEDYSGGEHKLIYDGLTDTAAVIPTNSEQVDFVFDLAANVKLNKLTFSTESPQISEIKFYASDSEEKVWTEQALVYHFKNDSPYDNIKLFNSGFKAQYLRYSVITVSGEELKVTEVCAYGPKAEKCSYGNLIEEQIDSISYYLQNKTTGEKSEFSPSANCTQSCWNLGVKPRSINNLVDGRTDTVTDLYDGKNNEKSINLLIDLKDLKSIDTISFLAGSSEEYWPTKLNFYFGSTAEALFDISAQPQKAYTDKCEDGNYIYEFLPQYARYVRIEVLESNHSYYGDEIISVISELTVNGLENVSEADILLSEIKRAYNRLGDKNYGQCTIVRYDDNSNNPITGATDSSVSLPDGSITADRLGTNWQKLSVEPSYSYSTSGNRLVLAPDGQYDINSIADGEIWYKVDSNSVVSDNPPYVKLIFSQPDWQTSVSSSVVALNTDGEWHCFKISDCFSEDDWQGCIVDDWESKGGTRTVLQNLFILHSKITADITYGSMRLSEKLSVETFDWTLADWIDAADAIDTSDYFESNANELNAALEKAKALSGYVISGDCNFDQLVDIRDLVRMKRYLSNSPTKIFKYAAKMNQPEINTLSLVELRKLLLS